MMNFIKEVIEEVIKNGGYGYIVGGYVRDKILNKENKDYDVEIHNITPEKFEEILSKFGKWKLAGKSFKTYISKMVEFSFPIINGKLEPFTSIEEAARRRDITINSLMYDVIEDKTYDFFNGINDINNKIIRIIDEENFISDPLRILRIAQFKARFEFEIDKKTEEVCKKYVSKLKDIAFERIFIEIEKIMMKADKPSIAFYFLKDIGALKILFPEIENLVGIEQGIKYHPEGDVFVHTMMTLDVIPKEDRDIKIMLALLYHDIGKGIVKNEPEGETVHFYGHDKAGAEVVGEYLKKITTDKEIIEEVEKLVEFHMNPIFFDAKAIKKKNIRRIASKVNFENLYKIHTADMFGKGISLEKKDQFEEDKKNMEKIYSVYENIKDEIIPLMKGRDLIKMGLKPGNLFSKVLKVIYEAQLDGKFSTYDEGYEYIEKKLDFIIKEIETID